MTMIAAVVIGRCAVVFRRCGEWTGRRGAAVRVGWVERSETHQIDAAPMMGFAALNPSYDRLRA